ncbi:hypothetical protein BGZ72_009220 [Mortierella alpina]|nr:hypothetical protein BGZ72_009220 [Mortierella alpina]
MGIISSKSTKGSDSSQRSVTSNEKAPVAPPKPQRAAALPNPFDSQDLEDETDLGKDKDATMTGLDTVSNRVALDLWQEQDDFPSQLGPLEETDLFAFSSQRSVETLRRQTLSPKKAKRQKDYSLGSTLAKPMLTFSERLAAEMDSEDTTLKEPSKIDSTTTSLVVETTVVEGSDSGSEAEWNDGLTTVASVTKDLAEKQEDKDMAEARPILLDSDDDILTLSKFTSLNTNIILDESDSDLDEDPFSTRSEPSLATPLTTPSADVSKDLDSGSSLSDLDSLSGSADLKDSSGDEDEVQLGSNVGRRASVKATASNTRRSTRISTRKVTQAAPSPPIRPLKLPIKPVRANKKPLLFSLDSLLKEKKRKAASGYDLKTAQSQLDMDELLEEYADDEEEEAIIRPDAIPKGIFSEEQEDALCEIIEDEHTQTVEDIAEFFVRWPQDLTVPSLEAELEDADRSDPIIQKVLKCTGSDSQRRMILTSPYLMILSSSPWNMPRSLFRWLVLVMAVEQDHTVTSSVFALLQRALSQKTSLLGIDHWDLTRVFSLYGANNEYLEPEWTVAPVTAETKLEREILPDSAQFPRQNLKAVIKLINMTATLDPHFYDTDGVRRIMNLLLRMTTDPIIGDIKSLLGSTMVALLDIIPAEEWEQERHRLCEDILRTLGTSLPFVLLLLRQLPSLSLRISLLRRGIALAYLDLPPIADGKVAPDLDELFKALFVDKGFLINSKTNYQDLGRRMQVYGFCLDDERMIAAYGPAALEPLMRKLRMMHGKIIDARAAFMDRTATKDIIQRLYMRIYYSGIHRQSARQTTLSFEKQATGQEAAKDLNAR